MLTTLSALLITSAMAQDTSLSWQGRLTDSDGSPIHRNVALTFTLTDDGGSTLWSKTYADVGVTGGYVALHFGGPDDDTPARDLDPAWLLDDTWVSVAVDGDPIGLAQPLASSARAAAVVGAVQLTAAPDCTAQAEGALRWQGSALQVCNGSQWVGNAANGSVASGAGATSNTAGHSCRTIQASTGTTVDQSYWIDPDGDGGFAPFQVHCDMSGGGWTRILNLSGGTSQLSGSARNTFWQAGANLTGSATSTFNKMEAADYGFIGWDRIQALVDHGAELRVTGVNELGDTVDETYELINLDVRGYDGYTDIGALADGGRWTASTQGDVNTRSGWGACGSGTSNNQHVGLGLCTNGFDGAAPAGNVVQIWHYGNWSSCLNISLGEPTSATNYTHSCNRGTASITIDLR